jgi:hypothetical protein
MPNAVHRDVTSENYLIKPINSPVSEVELQMRGSGWPSDGEWMVPMAAVFSRFAWTFDTAWNDPENAAARTEKIERIQQK